MRVILIAIACAGLTGVALGQTSRATTGPATRPAVVAELIRQLSGSDWKTRQEAQDKLVAMGQEAAGALRELRAKTNDDEVRTRAEAALRQIAPEVLFETTRVTLHVKDQPADEVLTELCRQANVVIPIEHPRGKPNRVTVELADAPFWLAAREVCRQSGYDLADSPFRCFSVSQDSGWRTAPAVWSQNVLIVAVGAGRDRVSQFGTGRRESKGYLEFDVQGDPKLECSVEGIHLLEVKDDKGNSLLKDAAREANGFSGYRDRLQIEDPRNGGDRLAVVKGTADVVLFHQEYWEIRKPLAAKNQRRTTGGKTYEVVAVQKLGENEYQIETKVQASANRALAYREPMLWDDKGQMWHRTAMSESDDNGHRVIRTKYQRLGSVGDPVEVVWPLVAKAQKVSVPFEFKDLPLP